MDFKIRCSQIGKIMGNAKVKGELSAGTITYLKEWYAEQMYQDVEEIKSKYLDKGIECENDAIRHVANQFSLGIIKKNEQYFENEYLTGTPDILTKNIVIDTKCSWNGKTFLESVTSPINTDYEWQLRGYMALTDKSIAHLVYVLLDTPEHINYGREIVYQNPIQERFFSFQIERDLEKEQMIFDKVLKCREWLKGYDEQVKMLLKGGF